MTELAGFRLLRRVARGGRARLDLGFADGRVAVLKSTPLADDRAVVEAEALDRAAGDHVVALEDLASDATRRVLVLEHLAGGGLAGLLERRDDVAAGEAVTILVPIARTLARLHAGGVAHGRVGVDAVAFTREGSPTLVGFGSATLFEPGLPEVALEATPAVVADRRAPVEFAALLLGRVGGEFRASADELARSLASGAARGAGGQGVGELPPLDVAAAVAALGPPTEVEFDGAVDPDRGPAWRSTREVLGAPLSDAPGPPDAEPVRYPAAVAAVLAVVPGEWRDRAEAVLARGARGWTGLTPARRRLAVGGSVAVAVLALALGSGIGGSSEFDPEAAASPAADGVVDGGFAPPSVAPGGGGGALPDDPAAAAALLLAERDRCLRDLDAGCLATVSQDGSAARSDDLAALEAVRAGATTAWPTGAVAADAVPQRLGDSVLLDLEASGELARVLLIRGADGWRIRTYYLAANVTGAPVPPEPRRTGNE